MLVKDLFPTHPQHFDAVFFFRAERGNGCFSHGLNHIGHVGTS